MSTWTIEVENSSGGWDSDTAIPRSNQDLEISLVSTHQKIKLANGSDAFIRVETKRNKEAITLYFASASSTLRTQLETYMSNGDKIKITTHTGETFTGYFLTVKRVWFTGLEPDEYDLQCVLDITS